MSLRNFKIYFLTVVFALPICSCEKGFLDQVPDDRLTEDDIFITKQNTEKYLSNIYANIPDESVQRFAVSGSGQGTSGPWTGASSEVEYAAWSSTPNAINTGNWNSGSGWVATFWARYYQGIRNANYFMKYANADECEDCSESRIVRYKAEARALRALFYYYLMRTFGPVVIMGDEILPADVGIEEQQIPRNAFDECVDYVVSEFDAAAAILPSAPIGDEYGRMTRAICLAYKQEVLIMAASPLFNGNADYAGMVNNDGTQLINQTYDESKWQRAAEASKAFLDEFVPVYHDLYTVTDADGINAFESCRDVMLDSWNNEWIMGHTSPWITYIQYDMTPYHTGAAQESRGGCGQGVTQQFVDAFFMANGMSPVTGHNADGTPIVNEASGYKTTGFSTFQAPDDSQEREIYNQWVNREPRFYVNVTYNGRAWLNPNTEGLVTNTYYTGNSGASQSQWDYSSTGFLGRKNMRLGSWSVSGRHLCLYRLAQVYLNYVEALNEYAPEHPDVVSYLNIIRQRAGIPGYGESGDVPVPTTQDAMREAIHKERQIELALENVRFFDVRRWKVAEETEGGDFHGLDIFSDPPDFYELTVFETRVFEKKHYLFPLPQTETLINLELVQNTGWGAE